MFAIAHTHNCRSARSYNLPLSPSTLFISIPKHLPDEYTCSSITDDLERLILCLPDLEIDMFLSFLLALMGRWDSMASSSSVGRYSPFSLYRLASPEGWRVALGAPDAPDGSGCVLCFVSLVGLFLEPLGPLIGWLREESSDCCLFLNAK